MIFTHTLRTFLLLSLLSLTACVIEKSSGQEPLLPGQGGAGGTPTATPAPSPRGGPLLAIGDSILVGAVEHGNLGLKLTADQWEPEVVAENGRSIRWAVEEIRRREAVPRYIVVVLGSNPGFSSAGFSDDVQSLRDALVARGARRIVWIPPHHTQSDRYAEKEAVLVEADRNDRRLVVPDWPSFLEENSFWAGDDGLHLTDVGYDALGSFIRDALGRIG